jgi:TetR/AcrR family acrAB operon transcriptional repressor
MRRSREDSLKTRQAIVLAARRVFARRGVSRTSIEHIARAAGVTRGAVYGHFRDKAEVFQCMREQVRLPLVDVMNEALPHSPDDPLAGIQRYLLAVVAAMRDDAATRDTFHILNFKCEYLGDFGADIGGQCRRSAELAGKFERAYRAAARSGQLRTGVVPRLAALETTTLIIGLVRLWLLDEGATVVRADAARLVRSHVAGMRAPPSRRPQPPRAR